MIRGLWGAVFLALLLGSGACGDNEPLCFVDYDIKFHMHSVLFYHRDHSAFDPGAYRAVMTSEDGSAELELHVPDANSSFSRSFDEQEVFANGRDIYFDAAYDAMWPTLEGTDEPAGYEHQRYQFGPWVENADVEESFPVLAAVASRDEGGEPGPSELEVQIFYADTEILDVTSEANFELLDWAHENCPSRLVGYFSNPVALPLVPPVE